MRLSFPLVLIATLLVGCNDKKSNSEGGSAPAAETPATDTQAQTSASTSTDTTQSPVASGALAILTGEISPAEGAAGSTVIGAKIAAEGHPEISAVTDENGKFTIENVLPGTVAIYVASNDGASLAGGQAIGPSAFGLKLPEVVLKSGETNDLGKQALKKTGSFTGKVVFFNNPNNLDLTGSEVFVPGTGFIVKTDAQGAFTMAGLPPGKYDLRAQHEGFSVFDMEDAQINEGATTDLGTIRLSISNGPEGKIVVAVEDPVTINGKAPRIVKSQTVQANLTYDSDAALMKVADEPSFTNIEWEPVKPTYSWEYGSDGLKSLYVMYSDLNGLESSPYKDEFYVDTEAPVLSEAIVLHDWVSTAKPDVFVDTTASDTGSGVAEIRFREGDDAFTSTNTFSQYSERKDYTFVSATPGSRILYVQVMDYAGRTSNAIFDDIAIDQYTKITDRTYSETMTLYKKQSPYLIEGNATIFLAPVTLEGGVELNVADGKSIDFREKILTTGTTSTNKATIRAQDGSVDCDGVVDMSQGLPGKSSKTDAKFVRFYNIGVVKFNGGKWTEPTLEGDCVRGKSEKLGADILTLDKPHYINWSSLMDVANGNEATTILNGDGNLFALMSQSSPATKTKVVGGTYTIDDDGGAYDSFVDVKSGDAEVKDVSITGQSSDHAFRNEGAGTLTVNNVTLDQCNTAFLVDPNKDGKIIADRGSYTNCSYLAENTGSSSSLVSVTNVTADVYSAAIAMSGPGSPIVLSHNNLQVTEAVARIDTSASNVTVTDNNIDCVNAGLTGYKICDIYYLRHQDTVNYNHTFTLTGNNINCERRPSPPNPTYEGCRGFIFDGVSTSHTTNMTLSLDGNFWENNRALLSTAFGASLVVDDDGFGTDFTANVMAYKVNFFAMPLNGLPATVTNAATTRTTAGPQ